MIQTRVCQSVEDYKLAMQVTQAYVHWLNIDLSYQDIDQEMAEFESMYGPPKGLYLLAYEDKQIAGGVGFRFCQDDICEMKRLYVYESFQGRKLGRLLCEKLIVHARDIGYNKIRLDTLGNMASARALYAQLGFQEIEPYRYNPDPLTSFMQLDIQGAHD